MREHILVRKKKEIEVKIILWIKSKNLLTNEEIQFFFSFLKEVYFKQVWKWIDVYININLPDGCLQ